MTVLDNTPRDQYTATGGQVAFSYTFEIAAEGDIAVLQNGVLLSLGTGAGEYAVTGVGSDTGGVVTLVTGATSGDIITLYRDMALERLTSYTNGGDFLAADVNNDYDRLWLALQQNTGTSNRALVAPNTDPTNINMTIPDKATRLGKYLAFNSTTGNPEVGSIAGAFTAAGMNHYNFTGDGATVNFTLGMEPGGENNTQVYIDGVYQQKDGYNVSGAVVQFSVAPPNLSTIEVMVIEVLPVGATTASQVSFTQAGSTTARNVQLKLQESVSVKDFGAVGDGVTDDTVAIQAAINASKRVEFIKGQTYNVNGTISLREELDIVGNGATIHQTSTSDISTFAILTGGTVAENITVYNLKFTTAGASTIGTALNISNNVRRVIIDDCIIYGFGRGIFLDGAYNSNINRCEISDGQYGIYLDDGCHAAMLINNNVDNSSSAGVYGQNARDISIYGGAYQNGNVGVQFLSVESLAIRDIYFEGNTYRDVSLASCYTPTIQNCNSSSPVSNTSIYLDACTGSCKLDQLTYAASTSTTPSHIKVNGVNGITEITGLTSAAGMVTPIDVSTATNDQNVNSGLEVATNANGTYYKYDDGTLICLCDNGTDSGLSIASNATYTGSANTFPYAFTATPKVVCNGRVRSAANVEVGPIQVYTRSATEYTLMFRNNSNQTAEDIVEVSVIAIGRWK